MKGELGLHLHKEMLNLPIFEDATPGCLKSIALHTRRSFCAPGEFLVHKGDAANYLYLLSSGSMEILKMDLVVAILGMCIYNLYEHKTHKRPLSCVSMEIITKTCLYIFDPFKPHFYIVKLGFTGVFIIFLISAQNIDCGYSLEPPRRGGSNEYPQCMF